MNGVCSAQEASTNKCGLAQVEGNTVLFPYSLESEQNRMTWQRLTELHHGRRSGGPGVERDRG